MTPEQMRDASLLELFSLEAEAQTQVLSAGLLALERDPTQADHLESCMRAAHSLKGAARIVGVDAGVSVAHVMEDCLVSAQEGRLYLRPGAHRRAAARHRFADAHRDAEQCVGACGNRRLCRVDGAFARSDGCRGSEPGTRRAADGRAATRSARTGDGRAGAAAGLRRNSPGALPKTASACCGSRPNA